MALFSTKAHDWADRSTEEIKRSAGGSVESDQDIEALISRLIDGNEGRKISTRLLDEAKRSGAPAGVTREIERASQRAEQFRSNLSTKDEKSIARLVSVIRRARGSKPIFSAIMKEVSSGNLAPEVGSEIAYRTAALYSRGFNATIPWYCIVCYTIPIIGLICIFKKSCRGVRATEATVTR